MTTAQEQILAEAAQVAGTLPPATLRALCGSLDGLQASASVGARRKVAEGVAQPGARKTVNDLLRHWTEQAPDLTPASLAAALRAAAAAHRACRAHQSLELVWTGPAPHGTKLRRTDQVLLDLIREARKSLVLVTFVAYKVDAIVAELKKAIQRGVKVTLVLDTPEPQPGKPPFGPIDAFGQDVVSTATVYEWPLDRRELDEKGRRGRLHVKCAVADSQVLLVSSANLTGHAMNLNMELGLLIRGGDLPEAVSEHVHKLALGRVLALLPVN